MCQYHKPRTQCKTQQTSESPSCAVLLKCPRGNYPAWTLRLLRTSFVTASSVRLLTPELSTNWFRGRHRALFGTKKSTVDKTAQIFNFVFWRHLSFLCFTFFLFIFFWGEGGGWIELSKNCWNSETVRILFCSPFSNFSPESSLKIKLDKTWGTLFPLVKSSFLTPGAVSALPRTVHL